MEEEHRLLSQDEAAAAASLDVTVVQRCAESGLIAPVQGYGDADLAELRRVRRLMEDLGLDPPAIEVVLRMRRRVVALQAEVWRLEAELRTVRHEKRAVNWTDGEWTNG
jgi:uncharacterized small protein (DUF1192 family)